MSEFPVEGVRVEPRQSGFGIASFLIALVMGFVEFMTIAISGVVEASHKGSISGGGPAAALVGLIIIFGMGVNLLGLGLGVVGLFQQNRKRAFPILGVILNGGAVAGILVIILLGLMSK